ncbi:hypothetical protein AMS68_006661 [Peltaster fructicola]|uniref:ferric-chelate reductase (NADPH) n=1 Tax=Peltaster fructicola TaxID=286661 RepID=A0A6H0Y2B0_9PEZI|nr:hypothetical protein AMS68_006661 [Peltaster fructicola]
MNDMMDMGMDSPGLFTQDNQYRAQILWYLIAATVGSMTVTRVWRLLERRRRKTRASAQPSGIIEHCIATATAVFRETSLPQPIYFSGRISKYFTPPSMGRCLFLGAYWIVILTLLWSDVLMQPDDPMYPYRWEKVGFRAAWISVSQIPLIYLLSCKFNPISLLTGISYERFNWLHRWTARTVFLTVIVHWSYFFYEWWQADFVDYELQMMLMVKYGFGAWAVIGWMILSGFGFFRTASYEIFVAQHIMAAAFLLWLLYVHVPAYAVYNIWLSVAFLAFDWGARIVLGLVRNVHLASMRLPGYSARLEPLPGGVTRLTIDDADFTWIAGQHVYISVPSIRPFETHPFTIAEEASADSSKRSFTLVVKAHAGFSRSLFNCSQKDCITGRTRRVFLSWPLGVPPELSHYDTVVLAACSTGASFAMPLLQKLIRTKGCVRKVEVHWMVKSSEHEEWFSKMLAEALSAAQAHSLRLSIRIHVTRQSRAPEDAPAMDTDSKAPIVRADSNSIASISTGEKTPFLNCPEASISHSYSGRPSIESLVRPAVESALGETAIVSCGGLAFTAEMRNFVATLSDERAVHKGTGAQGIYLFTEMYGL